MYKLTVSFSNKVSESGFVQHIHECGQSAVCSNQMGSIYHILAAIYGTPTNITFDKYSVDGVVVLRKHRVA